MDHSATMRSSYDRINVGDIEGFGALLADDFVEHEETPGFPPTKEGVLKFFRMYRAAFPDLRMDAQDVLASGDKTVARAPRHRLTERARPRRFYSPIAAAALSAVCQRRSSAPGAHVEWVPLEIRSGRRSWQTGPSATRAASKTRQ